MKRFPRHLLLITATATYLGFAMSAAARYQNEPASPERAEGQNAPHTEDEPGPPETRTLHGPGWNREVNAVTISPDGTLIAAAGIPRGLLKVWDAETGDGIAQWDDHEYRICDLSFSPDGQRLASIAPWGWVEDENVPVLKGQHKGTELKVREVATGRILLAVKFDRPFWTLAFPDRDHVLTATPGMTLWDIDSGEKTLSYRVPDQKPKVQLGCSNQPEGRRGFSADALSMVATGGTILVTSDAKESRTKQLRVEPIIGGSLGPVALTPDGSRIIVSSSLKGRRHLTVLDFATGEIIGAMEETEKIHYPSALVVSPDGVLVACAADSPTTGKTSDLWIWDIKTGRLLQESPGPEARVRAFVFLPDRIRVVSGGWIGANEPDPLKVWDVDRPGQP